MQQLAAGSIDLFEMLPLWKPGRKPLYIVGGIDVARADERIDEIKRLASSAKGFGVDAQLIGPQEISELFPLIDGSNFKLGLYTKRKPVVAGAHVCGSLAQEAEKMGGVRFVGHTKAIDFVVQTGATGRKRITGIVTNNPDMGTIECERVLFCTNIWTPALTDKLGIKIPLMSAEHQYLKTSPLPELADFSDYSSAEHEIVYPTVRDLDGGLYYRHWWDSLGIGSYHHKPIMVNPQTLGDSADHPFTQDDWTDAHKVAQASFPALRREDVTFPYKINGMFSFTVDGLPIMGDTTVDGLWIAAALWVTNSGGAGKAIAEWMTFGESSVDMRSMDVNRFLDYQTTARFIQIGCAKAYAEVHDVVHPAQWTSKPRNIRYSPFHQRHVEAGAQFLPTAGLEIPYWLEENARLLERYEDQIPQRDGWAAQYWSPIQGAEHLAMRESVGLFDLTSLSIIEVQGVDAAAYMDYLFTSRMDLGVGAVAYSLLCTPSGGIKRDVMVARKAQDCYWIFTGNGTLPLELDWLNRHCQRYDVTISEKSKTWTAIGLFGPNARRVLEKVTPNDVSNSAFPFYTWQTIEIGLARVFAMRISYVGELGWEFHIPMDVALAVWDELWAAGREVGLVQCGVGAMRSMRVEKGYRVWGSDIHTEHNPYEAGMGWMVRPKRGNFIGKESLAQIKADIQQNSLKRRLVTIAIDDPAAALTGNEPIFGANGSADQLLGQITSGGYGYSVGQSIGFGYLPLEFTAPGTPVVVEYMTERFEGVVTEDCLFDPRNSRMKA